MTDMHIFIPSYNRWDLVKKSLAHIPPSRRRHTWVVVRPGQRARYKLRVPREFKLVTLPEGNEGLAPALAYIQHLCVENGIKKYVQMDDDLVMGYRRESDPNPDKWWKGFSPTVDEYEAFWDRMEADLGDYAHIGLIQRQQLHVSRDKSTFNQRAVGLRGYRTAAQKRVEIDRTEFMSDFSQTLQLLCMGHPILIYRDWYVQHVGFNTKGGWEGMRTPLRKLKSAEQFVKDYPDFVKLSWSKRKALGGEEWPELRIAWKKAAEWGRANNWRGFAIDGPPREGRVPWRLS